MSEPPFDPATESEIIEMALSDHVSFADINALHGVTPDTVKALLLRRLKPRQLSGLAKTCEAVL